MKTKLLVLLIFAGGSLFAGPHFYVGFGVAPAPVYMYAPPPPVVAYEPPPCPGPGYAWVAGYWYPAGSRYTWRAGYWTRPPFSGARWVAPRYHGRHYYGGYWRR
jgi:hypothetical protein